MIKKTQLSPLGWIAGIITALAIALYFSSITFFLNGLFEAISIGIFVVFEALSIINMITTSLESDYDDENHKLFIQLSCLHLIIQLATLSFIAIFFTIADAHITCAFIVVAGLFVTIFDMLCIAISIDWNEITRNRANRETKISKLCKQVTTLAYKLKSKLITTKVIDTETETENENRNGDKIKWK